MERKEKAYFFKVSFKHQKKIYREMALIGKSSLEKFAKTIVNAFDFNCDHAYGFFSNVKDRYDSLEAYTLFCDEGGRLESNEKSVRNSHIYQVFEPGKKMLFLFDYGDEWHFIVECRKVVEAQYGVTYPKVTKIQGEAPPQYVYYESESFSSDVEQ